MPFIAKIDTLTDYENLYGTSSFSTIGFNMLVERYEDIDLSLDEIGHLENYFSEYESLIEAAEDYLPDKVIERYNLDHDDSVLILGFQDADIDIMYDSASGITVVDCR